MWLIKLVLKTKWKILRPGMQRVAILLHGDKSYLSYLNKYDK